jgi:hypothetical protein
VYLLPGGRVNKAPGKYPGINFAAFSAPISFEVENKIIFH